MWRLTPFFLVLALLCGSIAAAVLSSQTPPTGTVAGSFFISPPTGGDIPTAGTVRFLEEGAPFTSVEVSVGASGQIFAQIPPGTWVVTGQPCSARMTSCEPPSRKGGCPELGGSSVTVVMNEATTVMVWCPQR